MKILVIATDCHKSDHLPVELQGGGVTYYRLRQMMRVCDYDFDFFGAELDAKIKDEDFEDFIKQYDLVYCKHLDSFGGSRKLVNACKENNVALIFDIDDNVHDLDPDHPHYDLGFEPGKEKWMVHAVNFSIADALVVSTEPLKDFYEHFLEELFDVKVPIYVIPNTVDRSIWQKSPREEKEKVVIGWQGSITHNKDLMMFMPALDELVKKYGHKIQFVMLGGATQDLADMIQEEYKHLIPYMDVKGGVPSFHGFPELLSGLDFDIGIAPLTDTLFNRCKSHIKWMEYALCGVPCVASRVYPYETEINGVQTILDGNTGFLAGDTDEWVDKLSQLIDNKQLRHEMGDKALAAMEQWESSEFSHLWDKVLEATKGRVV